MTTKKEKNLRTVNLNIRIFSTEQMRKGGKHNMIMEISREHNPALRRYLESIASDRDTTTPGKGLTWWQFKQSSTEFDRIIEFTSKKLTSVNEMLIKTGQIKPSTESVAERNDAKEKLSF